MRLPNLTGYLKLPGPFPVAHIELRYVSRPKRAPRFVPRTNGDPAPVQAPPDDREPEAEPASADAAIEPLAEQPELRLERAAETNGAAEKAHSEEANDGNQGTGTKPNEEAERQHSLDWG